MELLLLTYYRFFAATFTPRMMSGGLNFADFLESSMLVPDFEFLKSKFCW